MNVARRVGVMTWYTWIGVWRRWIVLVPLALFGMLILFQLPRIYTIRSLMARDATSDEGFYAYAAFIASNYTNLLLWGAFLAVGLGAAGTGSRKLGSHMLPILARPVSRVDFVAGRMIGNSLVLVILWLAPAVVFRLMGTYFESPVQISPWAYVAPLLVHLTLVSLGLALGTYLSSVPATAAGVAIFWLILFVSSQDNSSVEWLRSLSFLSPWLVPPLQDLFMSAAPFASPSSLTLNVTLYVQSLAWIGIFLTLTARRLSMLDLTTRQV